MTTEYQRLRDSQNLVSATSRRKFDPDTAKRRAREKTRRYMEARRRVSAVLMARHADEVHDLMQAELAGVDQERGPLPGDD